MRKNNRLKKVKRNIRSFLKKHPRLCTFLYDVLLIIIGVVLEIWIQSCWENIYEKYIEINPATYYVGHSNETDIHFSLTIEKSNRNIVDYRGFW